MEIWAWVGFNLFVLAMLALDLGVFHRKAHAVSLREAAIWSAAWVALALVFNLGVLVVRGNQAALEFFTGYLLEKSLSVDNIFVFALIFAAFAVPPSSQHRVLFWGILGALVMRAILIFVGAELIKQFHWVIYVFGGFLILTGIRMALTKEGEAHPERNPLVNLARRYLPITGEYEHNRMFVRRAGRWMATPLLLVLLVIESSDLLFAVDSVPAILAITQDTFIVYTSNVFAILGLRSLYFLLAGVIDKFHYLKLGLSAILIFVGAKMTLTDVYKIPIGVSLAVIVALLAIAVMASLWRNRRLESTAARARELAALPETTEA